MRIFYLLALAALFAAAPIRLRAAPDPALDQKCRGYARMQACTVSAYKAGRPCMEPRVAYAKCMAARGAI